MREVEPNKEKKYFKFRFLEQFYKQEAMSLIEMVIVIALIGTVMTLVVSTLSRNIADANKEQVKVKFGLISQQLEKYRMMKKGYPKDQEELEAYLGSEEQLEDPWGHTIQYTYDSTTEKYRLHSSGKEIKDESDDIFYPESSKQEGLSTVPND